MYLFIILLYNSSIKDIEHSPNYIYIYIYILNIRYIGFGLVGFYGMSTIVGYLMPNPLYTYILDI